MNCFLTHAEYNAAIAGHVLISDRIELLAEDYIRYIAKHDCEYWDYDDSEVDGDDIAITMVKHCSRGCCGPEYNEESIPLSYLWTDDWEIVETARRDAIKEAQRLEREEELRLEEQKDEEAQYKQYLALKKKYDGLDLSNDGVYSLINTELTEDT